MILWIVSFAICNLHWKELSANGRESTSIFEMDIWWEQMHLGTSLNFRKTHPNANFIWVSGWQVKLRYVFFVFRPSIPKNQQWALIFFFRLVQERATVRDGHESYLSRGHGVNCCHVRCHLRVVPHFGRKNGRKSPPTEWLCFFLPRSRESNSVAETVKKESQLHDQLGVTRRN